MSKLQLLKLFVNERLTAAAVEIFGAVERTIFEYHNDIYLSKGDKLSVQLTLAEGLMQEEAEVFTAVSQEVSTSEAETSMQLSQTEYCQMLVKQETSGPGLPEPREHWPSQDEEKLQKLLESHADASLNYEQSTESSSYCQTLTEDREEGDPLPGTSTEWIKAEEEADGCGGSDFLQHLSSESGDRDDPRDPSLIIKKQTSQRPSGCKHRSSIMMHVKSHANNTAILCPSNYAASAGSDIEPLVTHGEDNLCSICGKTFSRRSHLNRHMLIHTGQKPHCCKECGRTVARVEYLRIHMRIHTAKRPYACNICGKGLRQRSNMVYHIITHTGEKPHHCGICSQPFAYKKDVIRHMQVHAKKT